MFNLVTQSVDVGIDGVFVTLMVVPPYLLQQIQSRECFSRVARKKEQQVKFACGQINMDSLQLHLACDWVDVQITMHDQAGFLLAGLPHGLGPAKQGFDAGFDFKQ